MTKMLEFPQKNSLVLILILLFSGCDDVQSRRLENRMDMIEEKVELPDSKLNLEAYARFYAFNANGDISVVYTTIVGGNVSHFKDGIEEYCSSRKNKYPNCLDDYEKIFSAKAGDRFWLEDFNNLPLVNDGGCHFVQFSLQIGSGKLTAPECNRSV